MPVIEESKSREHLCPFRNFDECLGAKCMAWDWSDRPHELVTTTNLAETADGPRPQGDPPRPEGDGWTRHGPEYASGYENSAKLKLPKATSQRWVRDVPQTRGRCARLDVRDHDEYMPF